MWCAIATVVAAGDPRRWRPQPCPRPARAHSSAVEHLPYKQAVTGSIPVAPTNIGAGHRRFPGSLARYRAIYVRSAIHDPVCGSTVKAPPSGRGRPRFPAPLRARTSPRAHPALRRCAPNCWPAARPRADLRPRWPERACSERGYGDPASSSAPPVAARWSAVSHHAVKQTGAGNARATGVTRGAPGRASTKGRVMTSRDRLDEIYNRARALSAEENARFWSACSTSSTGSTVEPRQAIGEPGPLQSDGGRDAWNLRDAWRPGRCCVLPVGGTVTRAVTALPA